MAARGADTWTDINALQQGMASMRERIKRRQLSASILEPAVTGNDDGRHQVLPVLAYLSFAFLFP